MAAAGAMAEVHVGLCVDDYDTSTPPERNSVRVRHSSLDSAQ